MHPEGKSIRSAQTFSNMIESFLFGVLTWALTQFYFFWDKEAVAFNFLNSLSAKWLNKSTKKAIFAEH